MGGVASCLVGAIIILVAGASANPVNDDNATTATLSPCKDLPQGELTDDDLQEWAPEGSPGRVRVAWKTESQENTYGFNILRAENQEGPYKALNSAIIPGEGTTNVPKAYCFEDTGVARGKTYFYQIEEVTTLGERSIVPGTAGTKVTVKTVAEEREWLKKKAAQQAQK